MAAMKANGINTFRVAFALFTIAIIATLGPAERASAQNLAFMPGDAFFHFLIDEDLVKSIPASGGQIKLRYAVGLVGFGGYAGFARLTINDADPKLAQYLRRVYQDIRAYSPKIVAISVGKDARRQETEMNPAHAFVYNSNVDWSKQRIGLKYNEHWPNLPAEAFLGPGRNMFSENDYVRAEVYSPLIKTYDAVVEDWRDSRLFGGLKVAVPKNIAWGKAGPLITDPVVAKAADVQIIVTVEKRLYDYFRRKPRVEFYQVTNVGLKICTWSKDGELEQKPLVEREKVSETVSRQEP